MDDFDEDAASDIIGELINYTFGEEIDSMIQKVDSLLQLFEHENSIDMLEKIKKSID